MKYSSNTVAYYKATRLNFATPGRRAAPRRKLSYCCTASVARFCIGDPMTTKDTMNSLVDVSIHRGAVRITIKPVVEFSVAFPVAR